MVNPLSEAEPDLRTTLLPGIVRGAVAQPRPRRARSGDLRDGAGVPQETRCHRRARPRCRHAVRAMPRSTRSTPPSPTNRATSARCSPATSNGAAGPARPVRPRGPTLSKPPRSSRARHAPADRPGRTSGALAPGTLRRTRPRRHGRRACRRTAPAGRCGVRAARSHVRDGTRPRRVRAAGARARPDDLHVPARPARCRTCRRRRDAVRRRACGAARRCRRAARVGAAVRHLSRRRPPRPGVVSLAFELRLRAPDRTLTLEEATAARDAAIERRRRAYGREAAELGEVLERLAARQRAEFVSATKRCTHCGSVRAYSRSAQPIALRRKNSRSPVLASIALVSRSRSVSVFAPSWQMIETRRSQMSSPLVHDSTTGRISVRPSGEQLADPVRELVHVIPPRAGNDQVAIETEQLGRSQRARRAGVAQRGRCVPLLAKRGSSHSVRMVAVIGASATKGRASDACVGEPAHLRYAARRGRASRTSCTPASSAPAPATAWRRNAKRRSEISSASGACRKSAAHFAHSTSSRAPGAPNRARPVSSAMHAVLRPE